MNVNGTSEVRVRTIKSDLIVIVQGIVTWCAADYLRIRLHQYLGTSELLSGCLGLGLAVLLTYFGGWGSSWLKPKAYLLVAFLGILALYMSVRFL